MGSCLESRGRATRLFAPCYTPAGPAAFARDRESSREVWSAESGYPGDPVYRDFYRDLGFDRSAAELSAFVRPEGLRKFSGIKYHRITGPTAEKEFYSRTWALAAADEHARDFFEKRSARFHELNAMDFDSLIVSPFDAELFGHWWFEGPRFLESFIRMVAKAEDFRLTHADRNSSRSTPRNKSLGRILPVGAKPVSTVSGSTTATPGFIPNSTGRRAAWRNWLELIATRAIHSTERALRQAARELLLAQSSDWAFLMKNRTAPDYAAARTREHLSRFNRIYDQLCATQIEAEFLAECEARTPIFPNLDWRYYL